MLLFNYNTDMPQKYQQLPLFPCYSIEVAIDNGVSLDKNGLTNKLSFENRAFHDWYRFVLSFPPRLVDHYIHGFGLKKGDVLLDPFCGTGTSLVETKLQGINAVGLEANTFAHYASSVKVNWDVSPKTLSGRAKEIGAECRNILRSQGIDDEKLTPPNLAGLELRTLDSEAMGLLLTDSISPIPLHKALVLKELIDQHAHEAYYHHMRLAFANALVYSISNLRFGPEVGIGKKKRDAKVVEPWLDEASRMAHDLHLVYGKPYPKVDVLLADAREINKVLPPNTVNAVITSPPYPNEKDYTRTTRLETVLLGFIKTREELRSLKKGLVRSNTRNVYKGDDDDKWIHNHHEIQKLAEDIENRRIELGKTSGFEKQYSRVTKLYISASFRRRIYPTKS